MFACVWNISLVSLAAIFWIFISSSSSSFDVLYASSASCIADDPEEDVFSTDEGGSDHIWNSLSEVLEDSSLNFFAVEFGMVVLCCHFLKPFCDESGKKYLT